MWEPYHWMFSLRFLKIHHTLRWGFHPHIISWLAQHLQMTGSLRCEALLNINTIRCMTSKYHIINITWSHRHWNLRFVICDIINCDSRSWQPLASLFQQSLPNTQVCMAIILGSHSRQKTVGISWAKQLVIWTHTGHCTFLTDDCPLMLLRTLAIFPSSNQIKPTETQKYPPQVHGGKPLMITLCLSATAIVNAEAPVSHLLHCDSTVQMPTQRGRPVTSQHYNGRGFFLLVNPLTCADSPEIFKLYLKIFKIA